MENLISKVKVMSVNEEQRQVQSSLSRFPGADRHREQQDQEFFRSLPEHSNKVNTGGAQRHRPPPFASDASQVGQRAAVAEEKVGCESRWA